VVLAIVHCGGKHAGVGARFPLTVVCSNNSFHFDASGVTTVKGVVAAQEEAVQGDAKLGKQCGFEPHGGY
jgi:hypothetical protein